eukprot:TRINITY_DN4906_c0_g1_i1.p1 TRINITY_DN4906_c0_g1~~TRINITY_DN4906_c0_g1_i1.p1  ORF type:complete len:129 (+),score=35.80 TRINITY_DN4906_c0_g1_i1:32-388(+)
MGDDAAFERFAVQEGDYLILATDGLFDNIPQAEIVQLAASEIQLGSGVDVIAERLAQRAHMLSQDKTIDSPFAILAKENNILWKSGGRPDDVTVIVCQVTSSQPELLVRYSFSSLDNK